ncbi:hypothetical protein H8959_008792 [Pygathrix nigripes]
MLFRNRLKCGLGEWHLAPRKATDAFGKVLPGRPRAELGGLLSPPGTPAAAPSRPFRCQEQGPDAGPRFKPIMVDHNNVTQTQSLLGLDSMQLALVDIAVSSNRQEGVGIQGHNPGLPWQGQVSQSHIHHGHEHVVLVLPPSTLRHRKDVGPLLGQVNEARPEWWEDSTA